jgi:hypothetical protein
MRAATQSGLPKQYFMPLIDVLGAQYFDFGSSETYVLYP